MKQVDINKFIPCIAVVTQTVAEATEATETGEAGEATQTETVKEEEPTPDYEGTHSLTLFWLGFYHRKLFCFYGREVQVLWRSLCLDAGFDPEGRNQYLTDNPQSQCRNATFMRFPITSEKILSGNASYDVIKDAETVIQ